MEVGVEANSSREGTTTTVRIGTEGEAATNNKINAGVIRTTGAEAGAGTRTTGILEISIRINREEVVEDIRTIGEEETEEEVEEATSLPAINSENFSLINKTFELIQTDEQQNDFVADKIFRFQFFS